MIKEKKINLPVAVTLFIFGIIYASISLVNHYLFRTYAWDLGIFNNAIFDYAHFRMNKDMLITENVGNLLGDHLELLPMILSPLHWIFGSYTLLLVQIAAVLFGGYGIYVFFLARTGNKNFSLLAMIHFLSIWGIYSALAFDYHNNVVGTMFVPWLFYYFDRKDFKRALFFLILLITSKENMALWAAFICIGLLLMNYKDKRKIRFTLFSAIGALIYFVVAIKYIIPSFSNGVGYLHFDFNAVGNDPADALKNIFMHPQKMFSLLFENHLHDPAGDGVKPELHFTVLLCGGFVLLLRPQYLIMLLPVFGQKLLNDSYVKWGVLSQYSVEFAPILTIALFCWLQDFQNVKRRKILSFVFLLTTFAATINSMDKPVSKWFRAENVRFYSKEHYKTKFEVSHLYDAMKLIPDNVPLSAQSMIVPHLAFRDYIRQYPEIGDAKYIILLNHQNPYPLSYPEYDQKLDELRHSDVWEKLYDDDWVYVFRKK